MIVYIIMLITVLMFAYISIQVKNRKLKILFIILTIMPFIIVSGFRYGVGTDYFYRYVPDFNKIANNIEVNNLEIGFKLLIKICLIFSKNSQSIFIVTSILISMLIVIGIYKNSKNPLVSITLFGIGGFFFLSLNMIRQFLAMSIVFYAYQYLLEREKNKWYILAVIVACFIHSASIVAIALLLFRKIKIIKPWIIILLSAIILILGERLFNLLVPIIKNTRFNVYLIGVYAKGDTSILYNIVNIAIYLYMIIMYYIKEKNQSDSISIQDIIFINIQAMALLFTTMSSIHMLFSRISSYFMIFQIISIPYFVETTNVTIKIRQKMIKVIKPLVYSCIIICFLILTFYTNILHNSNEPLPYRSVFDKERKIY